MSQPQIRYSLWKWIIHIYSFYCFFPLMSLIWDCTQSHNFKTFLYESWKRCFFFRTAKIFMFTTLFSQFDLQFDPKPFMLPKLRVVATWKYFFLYIYMCWKTKLSWKKNQKHQIFFICFLPSVLPKLDVLNPPIFFLIFMYKKSLL